MTDEFDDCDCEADIDHFLHNLGYFHKVLLEKVPQLNLTNGEVIGLFKVWLQGIVEDKDLTPPNPLHEIIRHMFSQSGDPNMSSGHPFSFRLYDDEDEDEGLGQ